MKNMVVWITGASSGIGAACARACNEAGAKVILSARSEEKLYSVQSSLVNESAVIPLDVSISDSIQEKTKEAIEVYGHIDMLINNAGISQRGFVEETDISVDRRLFEVNYFGNIGITKAILPHFLERKAGNLVIISSVAGKLSTPGRSSYAATKHALHGFYDALRAEVADRGVHVQMICPGYIKTEISLNALNAKGKKHGIMDPGQAAGMAAEECARLIIKAIQKNKREVYIGGPETRYVFVRRFLPGLYHKMIAKMSKERRY